MEYELHFGNIQVYEVKNDVFINKTNMIKINQSQKDLLDTIANFNIDEDGNRIYVVNTNRFKCVIHETRA